MVTEINVMHSTVEIKGACRILVQGIDTTSMSLKLGDVSAMCSPNPNNWSHELYILSKLQLLVPRLRITKLKWGVPSLIRAFPIAQSNTYEGTTTRFSPSDQVHANLRNRVRSCLNM